MSIDKRINIRQPLTDQEEKCGHTYYGPTDIDTVLGTFAYLLQRLHTNEPAPDGSWIGST